MPVSADTLRLLMAAGLNGEALLDVVASIDADVTSTPRVRSAHALRQERYRQRKASQNVTSDASRDVSDGAEPSPKESPQTPKETPPTNPSTHKETPLRGSKKGSRLPIDFEPDLDFAGSLGLTVSQAETEAAKFRDYWAAKTGQGATKQDWQATWRNWVRTAAERLVPRQRAGPPARTSPMDHFRNLASELNGQDRDDRRPSGNRDDAPGLPVRAIEHHGR